MALYLGLLIFSFITTGVLIIPTIDFLFSRRSRSISAGGGILIVMVVSLQYLFLFPLLSRLGVYISSLFSINMELNLIFFTFISFALLGVLSDLNYLYPHLFPTKPNPKVRWQVKIILSTLISLVLYLKFQVSIVNFPIIGVLPLGPFYIILAMLTLLSFTTSFSLTDDSDGLSCGLLVICLTVFWSLSVSTLDTPLSMFIALWIGSLVAFLYFNIYPARITLGETGRLAFGATLAVVGLILGKTIALFFVGGLFMLNLLTFILNGLPLHHILKNHGWSPSKIMFRSWLAGIVLAIFGVWLAAM